MKQAEIKRLLYQDNFSTESALKLINLVSSYVNSKKPNEQLLKEFLNVTRMPLFLRALGTETNRKLWVELVFRIIRTVNFNLHDLFTQRLVQHPQKPLFIERTSKQYRRWSYEQVYNSAREIAAFFYKYKSDNPKVLIFAENSIDTAIIDLSCLMFDIFDTPLNVFFNTENFAHVLNLIDFDYIIVDNIKRLSVVRRALDQTGKKAFIVTIDEQLWQQEHVDFYLHQESKKLTKNETKEILSSRPRRPINQVATTMFTSGSTGLPKGVSFSMYNIITKRFARAAALPDVGDNEVFVCYLPLYHTFGRYLEMMGSIFWGGTYVMATNPSFDTLKKMFAEISPTGFISVPIRWQQFYDSINEGLKGHESHDFVQKKVRDTMGIRLSWGLSAAGYLDPKVFKFFQKNGISLNSGFGMTEATGGITMTPPFQYKENSVGVPLPGIETRLNELGELEIKGHYLARYLEHAGPEDIIPYPDQDDYWLRTGDIFRIDEDGHHYIIDRVKDIYKNNKGQTIAPRLIESKFDGVPGVKRVFLVGDGRPYNVLLIVPNRQDQICASLKDEKNRYEYFRQIVLKANSDLAPYERVVNFAILERDFSVENGELTPKGSYKRKNIEHNFQQVISQLYKANYISFEHKGYKIIIPRWLIRDLSILESDLELKNGYLINKVTHKRLRIAACKKENFFIIGDLAYYVKNKIIDIGRIVRQPRLWIANPELIIFAPPKANFDLPLKNFTSQLCLPEKRNIYSPSRLPLLTSLKDQNLVLLDNLLSTILHADTKTAMPYFEQLEKLIPDYDKNKLDVTARRLEALACHPDEKIRATAYQMLVTTTPIVDYSKILPSFINSGKTFLTQESVNKIAKYSLNITQLQALRQRMRSYRIGLKWPANKTTRQQFEKIFQLFVNFGKNNPQYYKAIRAELACWEQFDLDPKLAEKGGEAFKKLTQYYEEYINKTSKKPSKTKWGKFFVFDEGISSQMQAVIKKKLLIKHFLKISVHLSYDNYNFSYSQLEDKSIRISLLKGYRDSKHYRISINTKKGEHFDLHLCIEPHLADREVIRTLHRHISLSDLPFDQPVMTEFGYLLVEEKIYSTRYISQLSAWDKIRSMAEIQKIGYIADKNFWRKLFIRSISIFLKAWEYTNRKILPGRIDPDNVVVPEVDFSENVKIISLSGNKESQNLSDLFLAIYKNFYQKTVAHYPSLKAYIRITWLFHAIIETIGTESALQLTEDLIQDMQNTCPTTEECQYLIKEAYSYIERSKVKHYLPLALFNAIDRFMDWKKRNSQASHQAIVQTLDELFDLYKLSRYPELVRYTFYRQTYFAGAEPKVQEVFEQLLYKMINDPEVLALQLVELSDLHSLLKTEADKAIFNKMVFPNLKGKRKIDYRKVGEKQAEHLIVSTKISDRYGVEYTMREPIDASEVAAVYKLFFKENYPKEISPMDKHYVVVNEREQIIAGLCYKELEDNVVLIDGMAVVSPLQGRGIGTQMMEDFFQRMKAKGFKLVKAHFLFGNYYLKHNFKIDKKWGALVREL